MKKFMLVLIILAPLAIAAPGHAFFDWLFSGGASRDAIDNSALGDLRAWWTGNPGYVFNPWWSGPSNPGANAMNPGAPSYGPQASYPQMPQPSVSYYPPQGSQAGYGQPMQPGAQQYQMAPQGYQQAPQYQYQTSPQTYQPAPQYQPMPQTYQPTPQTYQAAPQVMQQPMAQQSYPGVVGSPQMAPQGGYRQ